MYARSLARFLSFGFHLVHARSNSSWTMWSNLHSYQLEFSNGIKKQCHRFIQHSLRSVWKHLNSIVWVVRWQWASKESVRGSEWSIEMSLSLFDLSENIFSYISLKSLHIKFVSAPLICVNFVRTIAICTHYVREVHQVEGYTNYI